MENKFEYAIRNKLRFPFKGMISVEDLWDLSVENLDSIYKTLNAKLKEAKQESLLDTKTEKDVELDTQIEIVKYIVATKQEEAKKKIEDKNRREQRQKIMEIIASKQDAALYNMSIEDLTKMLDQLS